MKDGYAFKIIIALLGAFVLLTNFSRCSQQAEFNEMINSSYQQTMQQQQMLEQQIMQDAQQSQYQMQQMMNQFNGGMPGQMNYPNAPQAGYPNGYRSSETRWDSPTQFEYSDE